MRLYSPDITKPTEVNYYWHEKVLIEPMPKPKQGEWIEDGGIEKCNQCGERKEFPHWNFCPNCGARMKGADDD